MKLIDLLARKFSAFYTLHTKHKCTLILKGKEYKQYDISIKEDVKNTSILAQRDKVN